MALFRVFSIDRLINACTIINDYEYVAMAYRWSAASYITVLNLKFPHHA